MYTDHQGKSKRLLLGFPTQVVALTLMGVSELASIETPIFLFGFLGAALYLLVIPMINIIPRYFPLPPFSPAELPPPPVIYPLPAAPISYQSSEEVRSI